MTLTVLLITLGILLALAGLAGCLIPIIPGPSLSYLALIAISLARDWEPFSPLFLIIMACLMTVVMILDYVVPVIGASRYGASKPGILLSVVGMLLGIFFFPPFGIFIGAFIGGVAGEIMAGSRGEKALKVGWGIFIGNMAGIGIKLAYALAVIFFSVKGIF
ncbi:MAG: DUF456 domain-containing protein [Deltaproteobacteria bacterium]|nr:DUF456 domain-containing protein [Deltaproteobacteria bacterium]